MDDFAPSSGNDDPAPDGARSQELSRRKVMVYALAASTLTLAAPLFADQPSAEAAPSAGSTNRPFPSIVATVTDSEKLVLRVTTTNRIIVHLPRAELGQGITTAVAMMIAEELDADLADIDIPLAEANVDLNQYTGGSSSVSSLYDPARALAATARAKLITAAARQWKLPAKSLRTKATMVIAPDGRKASFGELSMAAARVRTPAVPSTPKAAARHRIIGRPTTRIDARALVTGKAKYAGDLAVAGALPTVVARPPTVQGKVVSVDAAAARAMPGVLAVTTIAGGVAVVAQTFHHAFQARDALRITWAPGPLAAWSDAKIRSELHASIPKLAAAPRGSAQVEGTFEFAFVSHAPMEVLTAVADVRVDRAEIWFSSQTPVDAQQSIAEAIGLPSDSVRVHVVRGGGSFGRRLNYESAIEAALISKATRRPVKLMWSRSDDLRHGRMRPASHHRIRASHANGKVVAFAHAMASVGESSGEGEGLGKSASVARRGAGAAGRSRAEMLRAAISSAAVPLPSDSGLYNFGALSEDWGGIELPIPLGAWRSVDSGTMRTAEEIVVDEVARALDKDPVAFRRSTLRSKTVKAVLNKVAAEGHWGRSMPAGHGQGVALHEEYGSCVACLIEIDATDPKHPRVTKAVMAADVGTVINPRGLQAQLMGTVIDGISCILQAGLHIDAGAVREGSFADFRWARQRNSPLQFEAHILPSSGAPGGAGELGVPAASGAIANAYARATGTRPRRFPINF